VVALTHVDAFISDAFGETNRCVIGLINDLVAGEEAENIGVTFKSVNRREDMLKINGII
jgi:hypothetical protein